jgi:hypothetical protein
MQPLQKKINRRPRQGVDAKTQLKRSFIAYLPRLCVPTKSGLRLINLVLIAIYKHNILISN